MPNQITARCIRFHELGGPEVLKIEPCKIPETPSGHVRVKVKAIGLNRADVMFRRGTYIEKAELPSRLGYEASGIIDETGDGVKSISVGATVSIIPPIGLGNYGTYAEYVTIPEKYIVPKPVNLSIEEAASCWMQYITAYGGLIKAGNLKSGDITLITAASSSVGLAAIEIARNHGATPIATTLNNKMKEAVLNLSNKQNQTNDELNIIAVKEQNLNDALGDILCTNRLNVVFDAVGGEDIETIGSYMAKHGVIVSHGRLAPGITPFPIQYAIRNSLTMRGYVFKEIISDEQKLEQAKTYILEGLTTGNLRPVISKTFPFEQIVEAHEYLESNQQIGKIVVTIET